MFFPISQCFHWNQQMFLILVLINPELIKACLRFLPLDQMVLVKTKSMMPFLQEAHLVHACTHWPCLYCRIYHYCWINQDLFTSYFQVLMPLLRFHKEHSTPDHALFFLLLSIMKRFWEKNVKKDLLII